MSDVLRVDLFVEDSAHEEFFKAMVVRLAMEESRRITVAARSARGGHPRVLAELELYQAAVQSAKYGLKRPDLLIIAIDANCDTYSNARNGVQKVIDKTFEHLAVIACPDPHVERWYLADPPSFHNVVGATPKLGRKKCERDHYKNTLAQTIRAAGHPATLGGVEFAREIVNAMDLYRASRRDKSLKDFLQAARSAMRTAGAGEGSP